MVDITIVNRVTKQEMKEYLEAHMPYEINNQMLGRLAKCFGFTLKRQMVNGKIISFYAKIQTI